MRRSRLRNREGKEKLSKAIYESLCRKGCANPKQPDPDESLEDAYWWSVCREVYHYLNIPFTFERVEGAPRIEMYKHNLQKLVSQRQTSLFDSLAIAKKYIDEALQKNR